MEFETTEVAGQKLAVLVTSADDNKRMAHKIIQTLAEHNVRIDCVDGIFDHVKKMINCQKVQNPKL